MMQGFALPDVYEGSSWDGIRRISLTNRQTNRPIDLRNAAATMAFRRVGQQVVKLSLHIGSGITILSSLEGKLRVEPRILSLSAGLYYFELFVTLASGVRIPILLGTQKINRLGVPS